jgi:IclR family pca regulon transcriptional regulator
MAERDRYFLESLSRGLLLLEHFADSGGGLTLSEVARRAGLELTAAFRIAHTLEQMGYVVREPDSRRYHLGPKARNLGLAFLSQLDYRRVALPHMRRLLEATNETVSLATLSGEHAVVIERLESRNAITVRGRIGWTFPAYATSLGKALLAQLPPEDCDRLLATMERQPLTAKTIVETEELMKELATVRRQGYALNDEESAEDIRAVAAPIQSGFPDVVLAVNVGGPTVRITRQRMAKELPAQVVETARQISGELGFPPQRQPAE